MNYLRKGNLERKTMSEQVECLRCGNTYYLKYWDEDYDPCPYCGYHIYKPVEKGGDHE